MKQKRSVHLTSTRRVSNQVRGVADTLPPPSFEEACAVVADLFEAIPETWTKLGYAETGEGIPVGALNDGAVRWCAAGGLMAAGVTMDYDWGAMCRAAERLGFYSPTDANDRGGREVAIKMLRMAAGQLKDARSATKSK